MAYVKQTWQTGDVVTSAKLNHMEDGIANACINIGSHMDETDWSVVLNSTWAEIKAMCESGSSVVIHTNNSTENETNIGFEYVVGISDYDGNFVVYVLTTDGTVATPITYSTTSADGYPKWIEEDP